MNLNTAMIWYGLGVAALTGLCGCGGASDVKEAVCPASGDKAITDALTSIRTKHGLPAIAGAIVASNGPSRFGVVGVRKSGTDAPATLNDRRRLGSDTKAMTATLAARLVERQEL